MKCPTCGEEVEGLSRCENCGTPMPEEEGNNSSLANSINQKPIGSAESKTVIDDSTQAVTEYSFDSDLEFADADSLINDKEIQPVTAKDSDISSSINEIHETSIINQLREEISPEVEPETEVEQAFNELIDQELAPLQTEVEKTGSDEIELTEMRLDLTTKLPEELMEEQGIMPDTKLETPLSTLHDDGISFHTSQTVPAGAEATPSQDSSSGPINEKYVQPEIQIPKPPPGAAKIGIPASLYYQQQAQQQKTPESPLEPQQGPASVIHQKEPFRSFVTQEPPHETSNSFFVEKQKQGSDNVTSYDFQPSIYYKQILGDSSSETGLHRDEILLTKSESAAQEEKEVPPSFARSFNKPDFNASKTESHARAAKVQQSFTQSRPKIDDHRLGDDNKIISVLFKVVFLFLALSSFFLMDVFATINSPLNPYDQHKSGRYLVFIFIALAAITSLFIKNLTGKPVVLIPLFLIITVLFFYGVTSLKIIVKSDKMGNFFIISTDPPIDVVEDDSYDATEPDISSAGDRAMYSIRTYNTGLAYHKVGLIEFMTKDKKIESKLKDSTLEINGNAQWFENDTAIYADIKTELPTEMNNPVLMASKNELYFDFTSTFNIYDFNNRITQQLYQFTNKLPFSLFLKQILNKSENTILIQLSMIYTSPEKATYNFVYNDKTGLISACYMGGIWLIDPSKGISRKITRGGDPGSPYLDTWPKFDKDGDKVLFVRTRIGEKIENDILQIDTAAALASEEPVLPVSVTNDNYNYLNFAISPGGRFIASWIFASQDSGAKLDETALVLFDMKLNKHIKIYPLEQYDRGSDQFISNIEWSKKGNYLLFQLNRLLHSSIKRIEIPEAISDIDK